MSIYSPLRYPGGKNKLSQFIASTIISAGKQKCIYVEPFAGGAGVACSLLINGVVDSIIINDFDKAVYSFWRAVKEEPLELIKFIENTPITIEEWKKQKQIYTEKSKKYSLELAFSFLFLNRTNHSGILNAGPIGGVNQNGNWKLDARFNKQDVIEKIKLIASYKSKITIYNKDIMSFFYQVLFTENESKFFVYFDPPYFVKGSRLYKNFLNSSDHEKIKMKIEELNCPWLLTYDDAPEIQFLYKNYEIRKYDLTYSAANKGVATELMIFSSLDLVPPENKVSNIILKKVL